MSDLMMCWCGHAAEEHNYTPSGCGGTHCLHDATDYGAPNCPRNCGEYMPADTLILSEATTGELTELWYALPVPEGDENAAALLRRIGEELTRRGVTE